MITLQELLNRVNFGIQRAKINSNFQLLNEKKYEKPEAGIPKTDLDQNVQNSLNKIDSQLAFGEDESYTYDNLGRLTISTRQSANGPVVTTITWTDNLITQIVINGSGWKNNTTTTITYGYTNGLLTTTTFS